MTDKKNCTPLVRHITHLPETLLLELRVTDRQDFIYNQNLGFKMGSHRKCEAQVHARGISFDRRIYELSDFGEINHLIEFLVDLGGLHSQDRTVHINVLTP